MKLVDKAIAAIWAGLIIGVVLTVAALFMLQGCSGVSGHLGVDAPKPELGK